MVNRIKPSFDLYSFIPPFKGIKHKAGIVDY